MQSSLRRFASLTRLASSRRLATCAVRPFVTDLSHLDMHAPTHEFDGDAGDYVPKEVSIHERRQSQLTPAQLKAAMHADYDGDLRSAPFTSGQQDPAQAFERYDPAKHERQTDQAIEQAEDARD